MGSDAQVPVSPVKDDDGTLTPAEAWRAVSRKLTTYTYTSWVVVDATTHHPWATFQDMDTAADVAKWLADDTGHIYAVVPVDHHERARNGVTEFHK
jgi:hypothetical protein